MIKILDPQCGDNFVGRGEENKELKEKIENNGIVVITGDRGIGKTNLTFVVEKVINKNKAWFLKNKTCYRNYSPTTQLLLIRLYIIPPYGCK